MTEEELCSIIDKEMANSIGAMDGLLASQRRLAMDYYLGQPFGNEVEGRSTVVSRDVADTIEWILPALLKIFTATDDVAKFEPQGPEDEQAANQASDYINYIFNRQNNGFVTLYTFFKDALLQKNGFVKVYWDEYPCRKVEEYENLNPDELTMVFQSLQQQGYEVEVLSQEQEEGGISVKFALTNTIGKVCIDPLPPEEVKVNKNASWDLQKARFVAHERRMTASELREMGVPDSQIDDLQQYPNDDWNMERFTRFQNDQSDTVTEESSEPLQEYLVNEAYVLVDWDGDGIAERRRVLTSGNQVLKVEGNNEEIDRVPIVTCTPILMPHKLFGLSIADLVMDLQLIKSTIMRQILDNMYLTNNSRMMALDGMVNIDDLLTVRPGGIVRVKTFDAVKPLQVPFFGAPAFNMLEYIDTIRENRTGVTRYNQGIDANSLNKTASGINSIMSAAQQRIELIARIFAETGVKEMMWSILELVCKYEKRSRVVRLRNNWVQIDPREWANRFDMTVSVGLGTGSKDQVLQGVQLLGQFQQQIGAAGLGNIVTPQNVYNLAKEASEAIFPKKGDMFFTDPKGQAPPPPPPDPKIELAKQKALMQDKTKRDMKAVDFLHQVAQLHQGGQQADAQHQAQRGMDRQRMEHEMALKRMEPDVAAQDNNNQAQQALMQMMQQMQAMQQQQAMLAQSMAELGKVMAAPKRIVTDNAGNPVGVEPVL